MRRRIALTLLLSACSTREHAQELPDASSRAIAPIASATTWGTASPATSAASAATASPETSVASSATATAAGVTSAAVVPSASASASATTDPAPEGMALVPGGPFTMGSDRGGEEDEHPAHTVTIPAFWLDLTEVTNEAWNRCVEAGACPPPDATSARKNGFGGDAAFRGPKQPVSAVSWDEARAYCARLGKRLPTEAEWEKAARGTDRRRFPWGNDEPTAEHAVFSGTGLTQPVGTHPKGDGPFGHHDLAGNVWEWVEDVYDPYAYRRPGAAEGKGSTCEQAKEACADLREHGKKGFTGSNPIPTECERVLRGGAFNYPGPGLRATNRVHHPGRFHLVMSGFRCAKDAR